MVQAFARFHQAKQSVHRAKELMKARHDQKAVAHQYKIGDKVMLSSHNLGLRHERRRGKLLPRWLCPLEVTGMVGRNAVRLNMPAYLTKAYHPTVSVSIVKPYHERMGTSPPPVIIAGEPEWEVDYIVSHHYGGDKSVSFMVKCKGFDEPEPTLAKDLTSCTDVLKNSSRTRSGMNE